MSAAVLGFELCAPALVGVGAGVGAERVARADPPAAAVAAPSVLEQPLPLDARAENVSFDARSREIDLEGDVRLDEAPFYLRSDRLRLRRVALGLDVEGTGRLIFCPCLGAPLAVGFSGGTVAPPGDVILRSPRLLLFGLPVFWLPAIWLRSPARVGVLPPDVTWRGTDGLFLGEGVHLPFRGDDSERGLDLRGGGYVQGGAAAEARLVDGTGTTRVAWDHLRGDGLTVDMRGAVPASVERSALPSVGWDVDALRGARGLRSTSDLDAVSRPVDRGQASAAWRFGSDRAGGAGNYGQWTVAVDERAAAARGGELAEIGMQGPEAIVRTAGGTGGEGPPSPTTRGSPAARSAGSSCRRPASRGWTPARSSRPSWRPSASRCGREAPPMGPTTGRRRRWRGARRSAGSPRCRCRARSAAGTIATDPMPTCIAPSRGSSSAR